MKISFEAADAAQLIDLVVSFANSQDRTIPSHDQAILDGLLRDHRRLVRRLERLDAATPPVQAP